MDMDAGKALESAVMGYFRAPDARAVVDVFAAAPVSEHWRAQTVLTLPVFLALVLDSAPEVAPVLVAAVKGGDPVKVEVVAQALNYSHHRERCRLMETLVGEAAAASMDDLGADFKAFVPTHPIHVDMLWAAFFATGDAAYVSRIAGLLAGWLPEAQLQALLPVAARDEEAAQRAMAGVLAGTAQASLAANAREFEEVHAALQAYADSRDGIGSALAARILAGLAAGQ